MAIQVRDSLTDGAMAKRLGCSRSLWNQVKRGKLVFSPEMAIRAAGAFPELTFALLELASDTVNTPTKVSEKVA